LLALIAGVFLRQPAVALLLIARFLLVIVIEEKVAKFIEIVIASIVVLVTRRIRTYITKFCTSSSFSFISFCKVNIIALVVCYYTSVTLP
jgi:hypothetical protein